MPSINSMAASLAPPCKGPRNEPIAPVMHECISLKVEAQTRAVKVEALNSCSAYKISEACITRVCNSDGFWPCRVHKNCSAKESASVSTSMRLPLWLKLYQ